MSFAIMADAVVASVNVCFNLVYQIVVFGLRFLDIFGAAPLAARL